MAVKSDAFVLDRLPADVTSALQPFVGKFDQMVGWATHIVVGAQDIKLVHPLNGGYHVLNGARTLEAAIGQYFEPTTGKLRAAQAAARAEGLEMTLASGADVAMTAYTLEKDGRDYYLASATKRQLGPEELRFVFVPQGHPLIEKYNKN